MLNKYSHAKCMSAEGDTVVQLFPEDAIMCAVLWLEIIVPQKSHSCHFSLYQEVKGAVRDYANQNKKPAG